MPQREKPLCPEVFRQPELKTKADQVMNIPLARRYGAYMGAVRNGLWRLLVVNVARRWTELPASLMSGYEAFAFVKRDFLLYKAHGAWFFIKDFTTFGVFKTICRLRYA